jgi:CRP/FNR family transcriptional regulator, cyclic AMP receptor protein
MNSSFDSIADLPAPESTAVRTFQQGEVIFRQGDQGAEAYLLEEGSVRLIKKVRGEGRSLSILKAGDLFGESALVPDTVRSSTAIALTAGLARILDPRILPHLLERDPATAARMVEQLVLRLQEAEDQIEIMMLSDTQSKVVAALLKLAQKARSEGASSSAAAAASFAMSPMELSTRVGLDVDTVKRTVQQLREGQYLRVSEGRLEVPDVESLRRLYALLGVKDEIRGEG